MKNTFGLLQYRGEHYFKVVIGQEVRIYEVFINYDFSRDREELVEQEKACITLFQFEQIAPTLTFKFNNQLKEQGLSTSHFVKGDNYLQKLYGKQLLLLVWAIEDTENPLEIKSAILNWNGFSQEEQWWLFTTINAASGKVDDRYGWRLAIKQALISNPTN